ncbi:hypothetical protein [Streptomyces sp. NPDC093970]|uniref:hypothetical protein n=1 Tax=Streptomyces sp. NPDC093970 TaxID=3155076 RepID=UPI003415B038
MTTTFDLSPGSFTTREEMAADYGCGTAQGIEPADAAGKVFVYSDPAAGEKFGYTFDGRTDDDEFGALYLYTGAGANGDQKPTNRNGSLLTAEAKGREIHLFVADGKVPGGGAKRQRYIGQMIVDAVKPYEVHRGPGQDGVMRNALVFRLRPAPRTTPKWMASDWQQPALKSGYEITAPVVKVPAPVVLPKQSGARVKKTEQHGVKKSVVDVEAAQRTILYREAELVEAFVAHLTAAGHATHSFEITIKGEPGTLTPDLYDATDHALYEAKGITTRANVRMAIGQLADYRRHIPGRKELRVVVLLPSEPTEDVKDLLGEEYVELVYRTANGFVGWPLVSTEA